MTVTYADRPVRLPGRSRQGIVLGMDSWQLGFITTAALVILVFINRFGPLGLLYAAPLYAPLGVSAVVTVHGMSVPKMAGLWLMKQIRHAAGATAQTFRPERTQLLGTLNLPGIRASVQLWDVDDVACVYDPHGRTVSITAELEVQGFLMHDTPERLDLAERLSRVLASFTQRPGIKRVVLDERTLPTTIRAARAHYDAVTRSRSVDRTSPVAVNYEQVMDQSERFAVSHRNYLTITLDLLALTAQVKALGGGKTGVQTLAFMETRTLADTLTDANIHVRGWLSPRQVAALARVTFDPESAAHIQNRDDAHAGVDPAAIGPMYLEEPRGSNHLVRTDSGVHTTLWIHEWPRTDAYVGFVSPIVFARHPHTGEAVTHIFSIVLTPVPLKRALKRVRDDKKIWRGNERMRARRGADGSAADKADWDALEKEEEELVAGNGEFRYGAYLTVSARDEAQLDQAVAGMRNALVQAEMEAQILYCQQAEALMVNALPLGLGMR
ncbi:SCO6880 family protein [Microbacterium hydrocarbonoxydans]|uniref:SCO6880 family protein n=1 Tax=Microbacterium hydrocarbonoxydans TaxID=273678 RepID=UPI003D99DD2B